MIKKVAAVNDLSGAGRCSLTAAIPVLSTLGVQAFPLPTAILSNQTGYESFYIYDFTDKMDNFTYQWQKMGLSFDGIYTGFIAGEAQVKKIQDFIRVFKKENTLLLVDPIMGDDGEVYPNFSEELRNRITELAFEADIITPNLTECCILTGTDYKGLMEKQNSEDFLNIVIQCGEKLIRGSVKQAVITGIRHKEPCDSEEMLYNIIITGRKSDIVKGKIMGGSYSGTGDILASVICGMVVNGRGLKEAVELAAEFIHAAIEDTYHEGTDRNDGINFEKYLYMLNNKGFCKPDQS